MRIHHFYADTLSIDRFEALPGQAWCMLGRNRSGIDLFFKLLARAVPANPEQVQVPSHCGVFSFEAQQALFEEELKKDDTDFMDRLDPGTLARDFVTDMEKAWDLILAFDLQGIMDQGFRQLSTGQSRKLLLLSQISKGATCLLIQSPYDGLDPRACQELDKALAHCAALGMEILICINNPEDLPSWATHIGILDHGRLAASGPRQAMLERIRNLGSQGEADFKARAEDFQPVTGAATPPRELVRLEQGQAGYQGKTIFKGLDLLVRTGQHTLISGPNGCGKSTLLQMIMGDHPACYQNRLWIFGTRRGTGESIWEIKQNMGIVSHDLHRNYIVPGSVLDCVLSGLFDSIGLYTQPSPEDKKRGMAWLARISMASRSGEPFRQLSFADQRLVLIARALIKQPELLILDEPTQGLDQGNRNAILGFLNGVAQDQLSTILYVSHRQDEKREFFVQHLAMAHYKG